MLFTFFGVTQQTMFTFIHIKAAIYGLPLTLDLDNIRLIQVDFVE